MHFSKIMCISEDKLTVSKVLNLQETYEHEVYTKQMTIFR